MGFQSYRVMRLCVPDYSTAANARHSKRELRRLYEETNVVDFVIRYESLQDDLCDLLATALDYCVRVPRRCSMCGMRRRSIRPRGSITLDDLKLRPGSGGSWTIASGCWGISSAESGRRLFRIFARDRPGVLRVHHVENVDQELCDTLRCPASIAPGR